jgi:hypothetical protein
LCLKRIPDWLVTSTNSMGPAGLAGAEIFCGVALAVGSGCPAGSDETSGDADGFVDEDADWTLSDGFC